MTDNCVEETLISIYRPHFYSLIQTETYGNYCGKELLSSHETPNISQSGLVFMVFVLCVLAIVTTEVVSETIKRIRKWIKSKKS